jgi:hypothetical protein
MSTLSQLGQVNSTYNMCLWAITENSSLYILKCDEKSNPQKPWSNLKLGKVVNCSLSKTWMDDKGIKKVVFEIATERRVASADGDIDDLNNSFSAQDFENEVYILQEHLYTDFRDSAPQNILYLPRGPIPSTVIGESCHRDKMNSTDNLLKKQLQEMGNNNMVGEPKKPLNVWDITEALHQHRVRIAVENMDKKRIKEAWVKAKQCLQAPCQSQSSLLGFPAGSGTEYGQDLGSHFPNDDGEVRPCGQQKIVVPDNLDWAKDMAGIADVELQRWLKRMVNGDYTAKDFQNRCLLYKKQLRVQQDITYFINTMRPAEELKNFTEVGQKYAAFRKPDLFDTLVDWSGDVAEEKLNQHVQQCCRVILDAHDKAVAIETEVSVAYCFECTVYMLNMCVCVTGKKGCSCQFVRHGVPVNHGKWSNCEVVSL